VLQSPVANAQVAPRFVVSGKRTTPFDPDLHVWLLIRAQVDGSRWYAYPHEIIGRPDGTWEVELGVGGPPNVRHELRVGVVNNATHGRLLQHITEQPGDPLEPGPSQPSFTSTGKPHDDLPEGFWDEASVTVVRK
jgi:hypothetical protein